MVSEEQSQSPPIPSLGSKANSSPGGSASVSLCPHSQALTPYRAQGFHADFSLHLILSIRHLLSFCPTLLSHSLAIMGRLAVLILPFLSHLMGMWKAHLFNSLPLIV